MVDMWMVRAGTDGFLYDDFREKNVIAIGWDLGDLSDKNMDEIKELYHEKYDKIKNKEESRTIPTEIYRFVHEIKNGDYVVSYKYVTRSYILGKITSDYYRGNVISKIDRYHKSYRDLYDVEWVGEISRDYLNDLSKKHLAASSKVAKIDENVANHVLKKVYEVPMYNIKDIEEEPFESDLKRNMIYFGAPGTGKSYNLNKDLDDLTYNYERVTFHPDYSYANFVGTYKPVPKGKEISYEYVPGPFMRTLVKALRKPSEPFLLVIEEINRANAAAVFGDVFQLLDRDSNNESRYPIETTEDMRGYLKKEVGKNFEKIKIPSNMFIWATMNSADQGVFPMDTAFKRRWDFKYFGISHNEHLVSNIKVELNGLNIFWNDLRKAINKELLTYRINEDKLLGPFFVFNEYLDSEISSNEFKEIFKNKIIMYLFEDAARSKRNELFSGVSKKSNITYSQICEAFDEIGVEIFCDNIKEKFIKEEE